MINNKEESLIIPEEEIPIEAPKSPNPKKALKILPKNKKAMLLYGFLLASSGTIFGYKVSFYNSFFDSFIEKIYKIDDEDRKINIYSNLAFFFPIGCLIAAITSFRIYEKIGRYNSFRLLFLLGIINYFINNIIDVYILYIGRILEGFISCFWLFVSHLMIKEVVCVEVRGMVANSFIVFLMLGVNLGFMFANKNNVEQWRLLMFLPLFFDLPKMIILHFYFPIRSPEYLYHKNSKNIQNIEKILKNNYNIFYTPSSSLTLSQNFLKAKKKTKTKKKLTIKSLLQKDYKKHMYFALFINLSQQITGITTLVNFSTLIYTKLNVKHPHIYTIIMGICSLLSVILITLIGNRIKKKKPLFVSLVLQALSWFFILISVLEDSLFFLILGSCVFVSANSVYKSIHLSYVVDFIPSQGLSVASVSKWIINILFAKFFLYVFEIVGIFYVALGFMGISILCSVVFIGFAVCTHEKSDMQIFEEFKNKKFMKD